MATVYGVDALKSFRISLLIGFWVLSGCGSVGSSDGNDTGVPDSGNTADVASVDTGSGIDVGTSTDTTTDVSVDVAADTATSCPGNEGCPCEGNGECTNGVCSDGSCIVCEAENAGDEICDNVDNDCDGQTDEDFLTGGFYVHPEHCGDCETNCVTAFENGVGTCGLVNGLPGCVLESCTEGFVLVDSECTPIAEGLCDVCSTDDDCLEGSSCRSVGAGMFCVQSCGDDQDSCPQGFSCVDLDDGGACLLTTGGCSMTGYSCDSDASCEDLNNCTADACVDGSCSITTLSCDDSNSCTTDSCDPASGCINEALADETVCDDGDGCTSGEVCSGGSCTNGTLQSCDDGLACTNDSCTSTDSESSECVNEISPTSCLIDGDCFGNGGTAPTSTCLICNPAVSQSVWTEVAVGGSCDDGNPITNNDVCQEDGTCQGEVTPCPAGSSCTPTYTNTDGGCVPNHAPAGTPCNDENINTGNDQCDGSGGCSGSAIVCDTSNPCLVGTPNGFDCIYQPQAGNACSDGNPCTFSDTCNASGSCAGSPYSCSPGVCEISSSCDGAGGCAGQKAPGGTPCDDGNLTTKNDQCDSPLTTGGAYQGCVGTPYSCTSDACTSSVHNGVDCTSSFSPAGTPCNDFNPATSGDACDGSGGCAGACPSPPQCLDGYTAGGSNCWPVYSAAGTPCNDGNAGTENDVCDGFGGCLGTTICPSPPQCITGYTPSGSACVPSYVASGTPCDDGNASTINDACDGIGNCAGSSCTICSPGQTDTSTAGCGTCQQKTRTCTGSCTWGAYGACQSYGECAPGDFDVDTIACTSGPNGFRIRNCDGCDWGPWGPCQYVNIEF